MLTNQINVKLWLKTGYFEPVGHACVVWPDLTSLIQPFHKTTFKKNTENLKLSETTWPTDLL